MDPLSSLALLSAAFLVSLMISRTTVALGGNAALVELVTGVLLGVFVVRPEQVGSILGASELGVLVLFFLVGLETQLSALRVWLGAIAKIGGLSMLAYGGVYLGLSQVTGLVAAEPLIVTAVLMTSGTGLVMRVLRDHEVAASPAGRLLLGASMVCDFPALALLAYTLHRYVAKPTAGLAVQDGVALLVVLGLAWLAWSQRGPRRVSQVWVLPLLVIGAWSTHTLGMTSLVGAMLVGGFFRGKSDGLEAFLRPISLFLTPIYFITVGMRIPREALGSLQAWQWGGGLFAIAGLVAGWTWWGMRRSVAAQGGDPVLLGWGMVPRGLPGMVLASLALDKGVIRPPVFFSLVLMVTLTNLVGLAGLVWRLKRVDHKLSRTI